MDEGNNSSFKKSHLGDEHQQDLIDDRNFEKRHKEEEMVAEKDNLRLAEIVVRVLPPEERILNVKNFLDFICDDFKSSPVYIPINTVSPSEQVDGMKLSEERKFRAFACLII